MVVLMLMVPFLPAANPVAPQPVQTASFEGGLAQTQPSQRIPAYAVPPNVSTLEPYNNSKPNIVVRGGAAVDEARSVAPTAQTTAAPSASPAASTSNNTSGITLFLTQLMGQGGTSNLTLAGSFVPNNLSAGDPAIFDAYADVKYMPSLAGKYNKPQQSNQPSAPQPQDMTALQSAQQAQQSVTQQRAEIEQTRAQESVLKVREAAPAAVNGQASLSLGAPNRQVNDRSLPTLRSANDNTPPNLGNASLLGEGGGVNAYLAASTRSAANITIPTPRFVFVE